jgi:conjugative relaxase-like TrwC/TraI family protein
MLSIRNLTSARQAASYFARDDYYFRGKQHEASSWWGRGAKMLSLEGAVDRRAFEAALEGELPGGKRLSGRPGGERRPGFDLTFSAPKSVSLVALVHRSEDVVNAHERAVSATLSFLEREAAQTRTTEAHRTREEVTRNLVVARFAHDTSRDLDPQLHTHCVVINATRRADRQWRSISNERIYALKMLGGAIYRAHLASELRKLGYSIERTHADGRFEIRGFSDQQLAHFSQRRSAIENAMTERGVEGAIEAKKAALLTREPKREVDRDHLIEQWRGRAAEIALSFPLPAPKELSRTEMKWAAEKAVDVAIEHLSERRAVFEESRLLARALGEATGRATVREVENVVRHQLEHGDLVEARERTRGSLRAFTTKEEIDREQRLIRAMELERDDHAPIIELAEARATLERAPLTVGQASAAELILSTRDWIIGVQGYAGTGKTTALATVRSLAQEAGYEVRGFAPSAAAASVLEKEAGIPSQTVASHVVDYALSESESLAPQLWIVDEASMLGNGDAERMIATARDAGARLVLVGDWDQLPSVEAGAPFRLLASNGMAMATMDEVLRQRNPVLLHAVIQTIQRTGAELDLLAPSISEIRDRAQRLDAIAIDYLARPDDQREHTLVLTASNDDRKVLNDRIRAGLISNGRLMGEDHQTSILVGKDLTGADKRESANYRPGDVIRFDRAYRSIGVEKGAYYEVSSVNRETNTIQLCDSKSHLIAWQPHRATNVEAYAVESRRLSVGDQIRWTRNDRAKHWRNGELGRVVALVGDRATVSSSGRTNEIDLRTCRHWEHGYASTVHAAQGRTADSVLLHLDTQRSAISGRESWYVAISRAREGVRIFTDDRERLPDVIKKSMAQSIARDVQAPKHGRAIAPTLHHGYGRGM